MKVHLNQIALDGVHMEFEDPGEILELPDAAYPETRPIGPVTASLDVGLSDGGLFATGQLAVDFERECVSCLEKFTYPLRIEDFAMQTELTGPETVDLTPQVREDILLALPPYPHCDWNGQKVCKGAAREVMKAPGEETHTWDALDQLKFKGK